MFDELKQWLHVTGVSFLSIAILCALGLGTYLIVRLIWIGIAVSSLSVK